MRMKLRLYPVLLVSFVVRIGECSLSLLFIYFFQSSVLSSSSSRCVSNSQSVVFLKGMSGRFGISMGSFSAAIQICELQDTFGRCFYVPVLLAGRLMLKSFFAPRRRILTDYGARQIIFHFLLIACPPATCFSLIYY